MSKLKINYGLPREVKFVLNVLFQIKDQAQLLSLKIKRMIKNNLFTLRESDMLSMQI